MLELGERPDAFEAWGMALLLTALFILALLRFRENRLNGPVTGFD